MNFNVAKFDYGVGVYLRFLHLEDVHFTGIGSSRSPTFGACASFTYSRSLHLTPDYNYKANFYDSRNDLY